MAEPSAPVTSTTMDAPPIGGLTSLGRPVPSRRAALHRIPTARNVTALISTGLQTVGVSVLAARLDTWWGWLLAYLQMGRGSSLVYALLHESLHGRLLPGVGTNRFVGRWLLCEPLFLDFDGTRSAHAAHHRDPLGPSDRGRDLYLGVPFRFRRIASDLIRDLTFVSVWRGNLRPVLADAKRGHRGARATIVWHVGALAVSTMFGEPLLYLVWFAGWGTVGRAVIRLREIADHGGMTASTDPRESTLVIACSPTSVPSRLAPRASRRPGHALDSTPGAARRTRRRRLALSVARTAEPHSRLARCCSGPSLSY
jgi:fatty acid desaturase